MHVRPTLLVVLFQLTANNAVSQLINGKVVTINFISHLEGTAISLSGKYKRQTIASESSHEKEREWQS